MNPGSQAHRRENDGYSDSEWFDAQNEPEWPLDPGLADYNRFPATGSPYTDTANWNRLSSGDKEIVNRVLVDYGKTIEAYVQKTHQLQCAVRPVCRRDATSHEAKQGLKLFLGKAGCIHYHHTPRFSDDDFHVVGLHVDTSLSPHADPTEVGRAANQALICNPAIADGDFNVNEHFSDDPTPHAMATSAARQFRSASGAPRVFVKSLGPPRTSATGKPQPSMT